MMQHPDDINTVEADATDRKSLQSCNDEGKHKYSPPEPVFVHLYTIFSVVHSWPPAKINFSLMLHHSKNM